VIDQDVHGRLGLWRGCHARHWAAVIVPRDVIVFDVDTVEVVAGGHVVGDRSVGDVDVVLISDGVLPLPTSTMSTNVSEADRNAIATYIKSLPPVDGPPKPKKADKE